MRPWPTVSVAQAQTARFVVSGATAAGIFVASSDALLHLGLRPFVANAVSYAIAFATGYVLQRTWTFQARHSHRRSLPRYLFVQCGCALASALFGELVTALAHPAHVVLSTASGVLAAAISFTASTLWVFAEGDARFPTRGSQIGPNADQTGDSK